MLRDRKTGALLELNVPHKVEGERFSGFITVFHGEQLLRDHGLRAHVCICGSFQERTLASAVFTVQYFTPPMYSISLQLARTADENLYSTVEPTPRVHSYVRAVHRSRDG